MNTVRTFTTGKGTEGQYYSLPALAEAGFSGINRMPISLRIVLESLMRNCDGLKVTEQDVKNLVTGGDKKLRIELPRILSILDPVFSLHQVNDKDKAIRPSENYLSGSNIRLKFDYEPKQNESIPLYIYSDFANFKVTLAFEEGMPVVKKVELQ